MTDNLAREFKTLISDLSHRVGKNGSALVQEIREFSGLDQDIQKFIIQRARMQLAQLELLEPDLKEPEKLAKISSFHKLKPVTDEIYERLSHEHLWEVVDFNLNQLYRSPRVFEIGSYSVEQYETYSPWELFDRPQSSLKELMAVTDVLKISPSIVDMGYVRPYVIQEILSPSKSKYEITHEFACPLFDEVSGENRAFVSVFKYRKIEPEDRDKILLFN